MENLSGSKLRKLNRRKELINLFREHGKLSKNDIMKLTHYSISTVIATVDKMAEEGIIEEIGMGQPVSGRPPLFYSLRPEYGYSVGIDFNSEGIQIAIINLNRQTLYTVQEKMEQTQESIQEIVPKTTRLLDTLLESISGPKTILCIGIACPGPFDYHAKRMLYYTQSVDIITPFTEHYHCPVYADKNLNCLATAYKEKDGRSLDNMVLVAMRAGVGMSCILNGIIYKGYSGQAGDIGHTRVPNSTAVCKCGKVGCLDAELSLSAITHKMEELMGPDTGNQGQKLTVLQKMQLFVQRVRDKQPDCLRVLDECCYYLSMSLGQMMNLFNPSDVFFYGELTQCGQPFLDGLQKYLDPMYLEQGPRHVNLSLTTLSQFAFAEGAAYYAVDRFFSPESL